MSKGQKATIAIGVAAMVFAGIQAWDVLDKRGLVNGAVSILFWIVSAFLVAYSVFRNLKDAHRASELRARNADLQLALTRPVVVDTVNLASELLAEIKRQGPEGEPMQVEPSPPLERSDPDFQGEFLEILFKRYVGEWTSYSTHILVKLSITNCGSKRATITAWTLHVQMGTLSYVPTAKRVAIPTGWRIDRGFNNFETIQILPEDVYEVGVPKIGWVLFEFDALPVLGRGHPAPPHNASFFITVVDSFKQDHIIAKEADWYYATGEIVESLTSGSSSAGPSAS